MAKSLTLLEAHQEFGIDVDEGLRTVIEKINGNSSVYDVLALGAILFTSYTEVRATNGAKFRWKHILAVFPFPVLKNGEEFFLSLDFTYWQDGQSNYAPIEVCSFGYPNAKELSGATVVENVTSLPESYRERWKPVVDLIARAG